MKKGLVSILILNWNTKQFLLDCLKYLEKQLYSNLEIIIIDNGSTDGSLAILSKLEEQKKIIFIKNEINLGFAEGNNQAYRASHGEYILVLNADTTFDKNMISGLVEFMKTHPLAGVIQPKLVFMSDPKKLDNVGAYQTWSGIPYYFGLYKNADNPKYNQELLVYCVKGACLFTRRKVIKKIGLFDSAMFAYFEETDFCHRAWLAGWECWYTPKIIVNHFVGSTFGHRNAFNFTFYSFRNRLKSYLKNFAVSTLIILLPLHLLALIIMAVINLARGHFQNTKAIFKAIGFNLLNFPATLKERKQIQSFRRVSDGKLRQIWFRNPRLDYYYYLMTDISKFQD